MNMNYEYIEQLNLLESSSHYTWITDKIAIGNYKSKYTPFDIIVNMNHEPTNGNGVNHGDMKKEVVLSHTIYSIGIYDSPQEDMNVVLEYMIPELLAYENKTILFHCYAGISRSSTLAIAYLCAIQHKSVDEILSYVVSKRSKVSPNPGFMDTLHRWESKRIM